MTISNDSAGDRRTEAEVIETDDGSFEVLPPEVRATSGVDRSIVRAITAALSDEPNALVDPAVFVPDDSEHAVARFTANYQEQPVMDDDGTPVGWVAPYRAREDFDAALREHLPEGVSVEWKNSFATEFYHE